MTTRRWEIWVEGYLCTGMEGIPAKATREAVVEAETFDEAVKKHVASLPSDQAKYWRKDERGWVMWGCRAYSDEASARESFG